MKGLFSTSGIRGVYPRELSPLLAFKLGCVLANVFGDNSVVGLDCRLSSPVLEHALLSGLLYSGCTIKRIGLAPLPVVAYSVKECDAKFGVMITASHNPPEYNGFKIFRDGGWELMPEDEVVIEEKLSKDIQVSASWNNVGLCIDYKKALDDYIDGVLDFLMIDDLKPFSQDFKVVVDCCNGPAAFVTPTILSRMGVRTIAVNANIDGLFPGRPPEPRPDVLASLGYFANSIGVRMAFAHDGDADRVAVIDEGGNFVTNDRIIAYMAKRALERGEGKLVITTIDTSRCIDEVVERYGGGVVRTKLGKIHVELRNRYNVALAAEPWKIVNPRWGPWADGILAAATLVKDAIDSGKGLSHLLSDIPNYPQVRESYPCSGEKKLEAMKIINEELEGAIGEVDEVWRYDGIRVNCKDGAWILIRASGTEPKIRLYAEAKSADRLRDLVERGRRIVFKAIKS
ncbi:MAG: phosphopentomutase/phosphoglucosamine mutase [Candidatus Nezhaarchaeales archaeon]